MKREKIAQGEHYHLLNRGVNKQIIFHDAGDYNRFLFLIIYFQSQINFPQIGRLVKEFVKHPMLDIGQQVVKERTVELVAFCIMPNHFHLIIKEIEDLGISAYMQRVLNAYSKYYNTKYQKSGHVFQGPYRVVHIVDDRQLLHLSAYVHRNVREISRWYNKEDQYQWSSYQDFVNENRWGNLLSPAIILDQFKTQDKYRDFISTSLTKISKEELDYLKNL